MIRPVKSVQWGKKIVKIIEIYPMLGSTNQFAKDLIKSGGPSGTVLWALEQNEGKGRLGRSWDADQSSLTFSLMWQCPEKEVPPNLTLAVGLGLVQSLSETTGLSELKVKWPNDFWIGERKLGGILTEAIHHRGDLWIILGIGLNVNASPPKGNLSPRISLQEATGGFWPRLGILNLALLGVEWGFDLAWSRENLSTLFRTHGNFLDRTIIVFQGGRSFQALAKDVLPDGRLLIEDARGERALMPEEITVRF
ncbi:MAG TPA: biotin--[acetyl-CoA-carboxylase] ligase [Firmicutes bacterium]|nr:biotin--[acetyl-CoA-carboxylase] ligase [Bacillota bacterium]